MPDGVHQVGLAQAGVAVEKERIVGLRGGLGDGEGGGVSHLAIGADDKGFKGVAGIEQAGGGAAFVIAGGLSGGAGGRAAAGEGGVGPGAFAGGRWGGAGGVDFDVDEAAGDEPKPLGDQIEVVVVDPNRGKFVGHAQRDEFFAGIEANDGLEPHMKDIFRKQRFEVAFHGFPKAGRERLGGH